MATAKDLSANQGPVLLAVIWTLFVLATVIVSLRFVARKISRTRLWWDDWLALLSLLDCFVAVVLATLCVVDYDLGRHIETVPAGYAVPILKLTVGLEICYTTIILTAKYSIIFFFWRIFGASPMKWPIYLVAAIVTLWAIGTLLTGLVQCIPLEAFWDPSKGSCIRVRDEFLGNSIPNIITDFMLMLLPIPYIRKLKMKVRQKIGLTFAFALGSSVTIVSIVRLVLAVLKFTKGDDVTWEFAAMTKWSIAENCLAPATATLPTLGPLLRVPWRKYFKHLFSNSADPRSTTKDAPSTRTHSLQSNNSRNPDEPCKTDEDEGVAIALHEVFVLDRGLDPV